MHFALSLLVTLLLSSPLPAVEEPPIIGQPDNFSGAVGMFRVATSASPVEVPEGDPVLFRVRITSKGPARQGPARPNLRKLKTFKNRFVIQDLPALDVVSQAPGGQAWEYHYYLKPRSLEVQDIPPLLFVYYKPGVIPREKGYWTTASASIPLTVKPRGQATLVDADGRPIRAPEQLYRFIGGAAVLRHEEPDSVPGPLLLSLLVLVPPALCLGWYLMWQRQHPESSHMSRLRRSRAAQRAWHALQKIKVSDSESRARQVAGIVAGYLWERFEMQGASTSPQEMAELLTAAGCPKSLVDLLVAFGRRCDAARYAADHRAPADLVGEAERVIHALEMEWRPASATPQAGLAVLLVALLPVADLSDTDVLARAERAFQDGVAAAGTPAERDYFRMSASLYEDLRQRGASNPALYLNIGNASLLADDLPGAILAYRRGLHLEPGHRELRANLVYARQQVPHSQTDAIGQPPVDHWPPGLPYPSMRLRLLLVLLLYALACVALTRWLMTGRGLLTASLGSFLLVVIVAGTVIYEVRRSRIESEHPLVVLAADNVILRKGNGLSYPPRHDGPLPRGVEARLLFQRGDWLQIELVGGEVGWVPHQDVLIDQ